MELLKVTTSLPPSSTNALAVSMFITLEYVLPSLPATTTLDQSSGVEALSAETCWMTESPKTRSRAPRRAASALTTA